MRIAILARATGSRVVARNSPALFSHSSHTCRPSRYCGAPLQPIVANRQIPRVRQYSTTGATPDADLNQQEREIFDKLNQKLNASKLTVRDVSGGCGSMYAIEIESEEFRGKGMVKQHRLVNEILKDDISQWHGLQLRTSAPKETS